MLTLLLTHWKDVLLGIVAIDSAIIPIFPNVGLLQKIKDVLSNLAN